MATGTWDQKRYFNSLGNILLFSRNQSRSLKDNDKCGSIGIKVLAHNCSLRGEEEKQRCPCGARSTNIFCDDRCFWKYPVSFLDFLSRVS
jgi:hypothetical protein